MAPLPLTLVDRQFREVRIGEEAAIRRLPRAHLELGDPAGVDGRAGAERGHVRSRRMRISDSDGVWASGRLSPVG